MNNAVNCNYHGELEFIGFCLDKGNFQRARANLRQLLTFIPIDPTNPTKGRARNTDPTTSHIGASLPQKGNRKLVLDAVTAAGAEGLTSYELSSKLGFKPGLHRRLSELERQGHLLRLDTFRKSEYGVPNAVYIAPVHHNYDPHRINHHAGEQRMNPCTIYKPDHPEFAAAAARVDHARIADRSSRLAPPNPLAGSQCEACNKVLDESEISIRGYASGNELGICRKCASHVNTPQDIEWAEALGFKVHSKAIHSPAGGSYDGGQAYNNPEI